MTTIHGDGISQADELHTLAALGVVGLNLENRMTSETLNGNNILSHIGSFIKADGTTGTMGNVNFMPDDLYAEYEEKIFLTPEQTAMSKIAGLGRVRQLVEALTLSSDILIDNRTNNHSISAIHNRSHFVSSNKPVFS